MAPYDYDTQMAAQKRVRQQQQQISMILCFFASTFFSSLLLFFIICLDCAALECLKWHAWIAFIITKRIKYTSLSLYFANK